MRSVAEMWSWLDFLVVFIAAAGLTAAVEAATRFADRLYEQNTKRLDDAADVEWQKLKADARKELDELDGGL